MSVDSDVAAQATANLSRFQVNDILSQGMAGCQVVLRGSIDAKPALLLVERAPFPQAAEQLARLPVDLARVQCLQTNDIYSTFVARSGGGGGEHAAGEAAAAAAFVPDLKLRVIWPCTPVHERKYATQGSRIVTETPALYESLVRPYMERRRAGGRLDWVYNILEGRAEVEDVIYRSPQADGHNSNIHAGGGFILMPDISWDRKSAEEMHLLAIMERHDLWSVRDLRKSHVPWLREMRGRIIAATVATFPVVEADQIKLYFHYQPSYYHLHVHVVHVQREPGWTQATGRALGVEMVIEMLEAMASGPDGADPGISGVSLSYTLGEASELWCEVFEPLKRSTATQ